MSNRAMTAGLEERTIIGVAIRIVDSAHRDDIEFSGIVVDETRDTLVIGETARRRVRKKDILLEADVDGKKITLRGALLAGLPEERIKRIR